MACFTDQENDPESGLMYYGARYYDPWVGRFLSQDPGLIGATAGPSFGMVASDPQEFNAYSYVTNRPTVKTDPTGATGRVYFRLYASAETAAAAGLGEGQVKINGKVHNRRTGGKGGGKGTLRMITRVLGVPLQVSGDIEIDRTSQRGSIDFEKTEVGDSVTIKQEIRVGGFRMKSQTDGKVVSGNPENSVALTDDKSFLPSSSKSEPTGGQGRPGSSGVRFSYSFSVTVGTENVQHTGSGKLFPPTIEELSQ